MKRKTYNFFNYVLCGLIISLILFSHPFTGFTKVSSISTPLQTPKELRGVWLTNVSSGVLFTPWGITQAVNKLSQLNFNTLYPVVWNRGHTFYPSEVARRVTGKAEVPFLAIIHGGSDVLAKIITEGHRQQLSVIPWFEYGFIAPANSQLAKDHPDWLTQSRDGKVTLGNNKAEEDFLKASQSKESNSFWQFLQSRPNQQLKQQAWLNPFYPEVRQFIKGLILEVVTNYNVDGIQLDDHFGMPVELGYDPFTVQLYQKEHQGKKPPNNPLDREWMRWRADKITDLMSEIVADVKRVNQQIRISLSPNSYHFSYNNYLQDWQTWVERGLIDELVLQVYRNDLKSFQAELSKPSVQLARRLIPVSVGILTGTWGRPVDIKQIEQQVKLIRDRGFDGVSFFYWETLWSYLTPESPQQRRNAFRSIFALNKAGGRI